MEKQETKIGDTIYSLKRDDVIEWEIISKNPKNGRFFIIINKATESIRQIHWKDLEYDDSYDEEFFSRSKDELLKRYKKYTNYIINRINNY